MTISPPEREAKSKIVVDRDPVETSFEKWAKPGHFSRVLAKVQQQQLDLNLHADAHDFDAHDRFRRYFEVF
jgi:photosystem I P700 chlorophyll a apoprotein A1